MSSLGVLLAVFIWTFNLCLIATFIDVKLHRNPATRKWLEYAKPRGHQQLFKLYLQVNAWECMLFFGGFMLAFALAVVGLL